MSKQTHLLLPHHHAHLSALGIPWLRPPYLRCDKEEYARAYKEWKKTHPHQSNEFIHTKALGHIAWAQHSREQSEKQTVSNHDREIKFLKWIVGFLVLALLLAIARPAHAQFSHINNVQTKNQGTPLASGFHASSFSINCSTNMTCADDGTTLTLSSSGGGAATGYQTIQNAASAIAQETVLNWTAGITCVDNAGATRSDCALKTVAAVPHQFFNAVTAGALVGAQPAFGDLSGTATTAQLPVVDVTHGGTALATLAIHQLYVGNGTSAPTAIAAGSNGQVLESGGGSADPAFQDPIVSGPDAVAATPTKNPVQVGCVFLTTPATLTNNQVGELECDASQNLLAKINAALPAGTNVIGHVIADSGSTTVVTGNVAVTKADGSDVTLGAKGDAKNAATDTTAISAISVLKQISASVQAPPSQAVTNAGTFAVQAAQSGNWTTRIVGNGGGLLDAIGQNVAAPANWLSVGCDFFTTPTTITTGNGSNLECDSAGNLLVNLKTAIPAGSNVIGHVITDSGSTTVVTGTVTANATLTAETTKVIGTVRVLGNTGATVDAAVGAATAPTNMVAVGGLYNATLPAPTTGQSVALQLDPNGRQWVKSYPDTTTTSYRASKKFAASSTTDNAVMPGNATNTVLVTKILLTCNQTTAGQINVELLKRSVADTVGTSAAMTAVPMDSSYAAAVSAPLSYTGTGPTVGTAVGDLDNLQIGCMAAATATPNDIFIFHPDKPIVLRGTAQQIAVNVGNAALTGGNITVTFEWEETTTP